MPDNSNSELSLYDFISLPTTVSFNSWYTPYFQDYIAQRSYIRLERVLVNEVAILYTNENNMDEIFADLGSDFLNTYPEIYGLTGRESLEAAGIIRVQQQPYLNLTGQGVTVGIVDTGIDYTLPAFRYEDGTTKIRYIWDQTITTEPNSNVNYGTVYTKEQIDAALKSEDPFATVPHRDTVGHGTYLASLAAGRACGDFIGAAPDCELVVVKLRKASPYYLEKFLVPKAQENAYEATDIMLGLTYVFDRASEERRPNVTCMGLGTNFGGHNGQNRLENYISFLSNAPGTGICTAVGNESNARHHTEGVVEKTGDIVPIEVRVGEGADSLSVYAWYAGWDKISVSIKSPTGEVINRVPFQVGTSYERRLILERSTVRIFYHQNESKFAIIQVRDVAPGTWEVRLHGDVVISGKYHAWLPMTGFISPDIEFVSPTPNYTVVIPSTAQGGISSGAYNDKENSLYINSSWGPTVTSRTAPDFVAPGVNVTGFFPTGEGTMTGTSASAAITTGASALMFQWAIVQGNAPIMTGNRLRTVLMRGCTRSDGREYPNPQWGYGRLNLIQTFNFFREE